MSYTDIRVMPIRYRLWYIERYLESLKDERKAYTESSSKKKTKKNKF